MPERVTIQQAEQIRERLGLSVYEFSHRLGYSATAYRMALNEKSLSRWMAKEIAQRFGRFLEEVRR